MSLNQGEIYLVTNKVNGKQYIGQTTSMYPSGRKGGSLTRWTHHVYKALNNDEECRALGNAIRKYGKESFKVEVLIQCNKEMLDNYERKFIKLYDTLCPKGYNIELGGLSGKILHLETREMISEARRFSNVIDSDKENILKSMAELEIKKLPMGIQYSHDHNSGYEGFGVQHKLKRKLFIANGRTLTEKLSQALTYYKLIEENNADKLKEFDEILVKEAAILSRKAKTKVMVPRAKEAMEKIGIDTMPEYIRFEKRNNRFYTKLPGEGCKMFKMNDPEQSLKDAIEYIKRRNGSRS